MISYQPLETVLEAVLERTLFIKPVLGASDYGDAPGHPISVWIINQLIK